MMWQEARKQEKKIRGMLVDYKRRAERRKDYYEKILKLGEDSLARLKYFVFGIKACKGHCTTLHMYHKAEPTQFIQLHGRQCKIHLDPAIAIAGDSPANMMSWQGNQDILIDRFDVRAHLDYIPDIPPKKDDEELTQEDRCINYERYRILAQNDFLGVTEEKFLHQLNIEEQFGPIEKTEPPPIEGKKKVVGATIAYNYNEGASSEPPVPAESSSKEEKDSSDEDNEEEDDDDSDIDFDLCVDVNKISSSQAHEMNASALSYGMMSNDFFSFLTRDVEEAENLKIAREREEEKAMFSGRKSRRERRAFREKKLIGRKLSPPSYAAFKAAPIADLIRQVSKSHSRSRSRSASPPNTGVIEYITSFGSEEQSSASVKASVHSSKEDGNVYKRTVRYRPSRSPESSNRRFRSSLDSSRSSRSFRSRSIDRRRSPSRDSGRRSRSPNQRPRSPTTRFVRYRSKSRSPKRIVRLRSPVESKSADKSRSNIDKSPSARHYQNNSKSKSPSPVQRIVNKSASPQPQRSIEVPAPPVITRYYGRRKTNSSSSELDLSDSEDKSDQTSDKQSLPDKSSPAMGNSGGRAKQPLPASGSKISLQERLKKKRQALINRQYKADKRAERLRQEKAEQERQDREDEMREISIKMRRRERQKRHQYYELDESNHGDNSDAEDRLSAVSSASGSEKADSEHEGNRSRSRVSLKSKDRDGERYRRSRERDRSREDPRKNSDNRRRRSRSGERDRNSRRGRDEERPRGRDRSPERARERSRERYRRDRDRSRERYRDRSRDRSRYSSHSSKERDNRSSSEASIKKPIRPLVDY